MPVVNFLNEGVFPMPGPIPFAEEEVRTILRPLLNDTNQRRARLDRAFAAYPGLLDRIDVSGETSVFLSLLLKTLREYGDVEAGVPAICLLLESIKSEVGAADRKYIGEVMVRLGGKPRKGGPQGNASQSSSEPSRETAMSHDTNSPSTPTVGIITALPHEAAAVRAILGDPPELPVPGSGAGRRYWAANIRAKHGGHGIVIAQTAGMGNNHAAIRASQLLAHFPRVESIIMCGIAAGVPHPDRDPEHDVRLGDIVVSNQKGVVQYDFIKRAVDKESGEVLEEARASPIPPSAELLEAVQVLETEVYFGKRPWEEVLAQGLAGLNWTRPDPQTDPLNVPSGQAVPVPPLNRERRPGQPRVFLGPVAAANILLKDPTTREALRKQFGAKAVEMESSGIADATWSHGIGYLVVRGVCDYGDGTKKDLWQQYAALAAAAYVRALLESMPGTAARPQ